MAMTRQKEMSFRAYLFMNMEIICS